MTESLVSNWFGDDFSLLHPMLQSLHLSGGKLVGSVDVRIPSGFPGAIGRRLAKRLGVPPEVGAHKLEVEISSSGGALLWSRCFDSVAYMLSSFRPVGNRGNGYWVEATGPLTMILTVDIRDGGWYWRCISMKLLGIPLPVWFFPKSVAYKTIIDGKYRFFVGFSVPLLGEILSYGGVLSLEEKGLNRC